MALPQTADQSDFHCVTTWSKLNIHWKGVRFLDLAALVLPTENAAHIMCFGYDDNSTNLSLEEALKPDVCWFTQQKENPCTGIMAAL